MPKPLLTCVALALALAPLSAPTTLPDGAARPDDRAARALDRAAEALGGWERLRSLPPLVVEARGFEDLSAEHQGTAPGVATRREHEERLAADLSRAAVAYERRTPRNDMSLRWRRFAYVGGERTVVDHNAKWARRSPSPTAARDRAGYMRRFPHLLLAEVGALRPPLEWAGSATVDGAACDLLAWRTPEGARLEVALDARTALVRRVATRLHLPTLGDATVSFVFSGWRPHEDLVRVPEGHELRVGDRVLQKVVYSRVETGPAAAAAFEVPESYFAPPASHASTVARPAPPPGTVEKVAEGVYSVRDLRGFELMFVEFRDFVLAVEAPEVARFLDAVPPANASLEASASEEYVAAIRRTVPDKPIRYVVVTHHHSDHSGGARAFLAAGATVLATPETCRLVEAMAAAPHTIRPDGFRTGTRPAVEAVAGRRVVTDGRRRVEVLSVGPNPHTAENLVVYLPDERIAYQGDLFYYEEGGPFPPRSRETMNAFFARWLAGRGVAVDRVYGTHYGGYATADHLARSREQWSVVSGQWSVERAEALGLRRRR